MKALSTIRAEITERVIKHAKTRNPEKKSNYLAAIQGLLTDFGLTMSEEKIKEYEAKMPKYIRVLLWLEASEKKIPSDANKIEAIQKEFDVSEDHAWWMVMSWEQIKTLKIGG